MNPNSMIREIVDLRFINMIRRFLYLYISTSNYYHKGNATIILSSDTISRSVSTVMRSAGTPFSGKEFNAATVH